MNYEGNSVQDEQKIYMIELDGLFPESPVPMKIHGTAGEVLERIADAWGIEDDSAGMDQPSELEPEFNPDFPSIRAYRAHQLIEDQLGKSGVYHSPDLLVDAMIRDGLARFLTDVESDEMFDDEDLETYQEERIKIDDEWMDGVFET